MPVPQQITTKVEQGGEHLQLTQDRVGVAVSTRAVDTLGLTFLGVVCIPAWLWVEGIHKVRE